MTDFIRCFPSIKTEIMGLEGSEWTPGDVCDCSNGVRSTRCTDCPTLPLKCDQCYLAAHEYMPFHHAEKWNGHFFAKGSQSQLGRVIYLGHGSPNMPCPSKTNTQMITVVSLNGIHPSRIMYCTCKQPTTSGGTQGGEIQEGKWTQLIRSGLIPTSLRNPATACTVPVLKLHHLLNTVGKLSTMDFVTALRRLTSGCSPNALPVSLMT